jgi:hypothetical protein
MRRYTRLALNQTAMAAPAPPVPARKRPAAAPSPQQNIITLVSVEDSSAPSGSEYTLPLQVHVDDGQMTAQTAFGGYQPASGPPIPPRQFSLGETDYDDVIIEVRIL